MYERIYGFRCLEIKCGKTMNDMAKEGWEVVAVTHWYSWSLIITFSKDIQ